MQAFELVGLPEGTFPLTHAATYLASAPKSNALKVAYAEARRDVRDKGPLPVPLKLRNAPTALMSERGYGKEYKYPHDFPGRHVQERYLPDELAGRLYYRPSDEGEEQRSAGAWLSGASSALRRLARSASSLLAPQQLHHFPLLVIGRANGHELLVAEAQLARHLP